VSLLQGDAQEEASLRSLQASSQDGVVAQVGVIDMANKKKKNGGRRRGIRLGATIGVVAGLWATYNWAKGGGSTSDKVGRVVESMIGINPMAGSGQFDWRKMYFTIPAVGGCALSMVASKAGLNRYTPRGLNI